VILTDEVNQTDTVRREDLEVAYTEKTAMMYVVAGATTDLQLPLGGVTNGDMVWIESLTANEAWSFKLNDSGNAAVTMSGLGFMLIKDAIITSIYVTVAGANAVTLKVVVLD
jgi:uncharacterized membrane protein YkgB